MSHCNASKNVTDQFHANGLFLYLLKTSENLWFFNVLRGYRKRPVASFLISAIHQKKKLNGAPFPVEILYKSQMQKGRQRQKKQTRKISIFHYSEYQVSLSVISFLRGVPHQKSSRLAHNNQKHCLKILLIFRSFYGNVLKNNVRHQFFLTLY